MIPASPHGSPSTAFRRSSFCANGGCVEVAPLADGGVAVRDAKDTRTDAPHLTFTATEWSAFVSGVEAGEFSVSALHTGG